MILGILAQWRYKRTKKQEQDHLKDIWHVIKCLLLVILGNFSIIVSILLSNTSSGNVDQGTQLNKRNKNIGMSDSLVL